MSDVLGQTATLRQQLSSIVSAVPFGIIVISESLEIEIINATALKYFDAAEQAPSNLIDRNYDVILSQVPSVMDRYEKLILSGKRSSFSIPVNNLSNELDLLITCQKMLQGSLFIIEDRTENKLLLRETMYDSLTQLLNRQCFEERIKRTFSNGGSHQNEVLVFIDLDRFKAVNDIAGHASGDEILKRVTTAILASVKDEDEVARIGGDEFALLLHDCSLNKARDIVHVILKKVENINLVYAGKVLNVSLSAGIAPIDSQRYEDVRHVMSAADTACRFAKADNEKRIHIIDTCEGEYEAYLKDTSILNVINKALSDQGFHLVAQEIAPIKDQTKHRHFEILLRLSSEDGVNIAPNLFIPVAERSRLMLKIDRWVIAETFATIDSDIRVSINLSGQSLSDLTLAELIIEKAKRYQINPRHITFEITETAAIENIEKTQKFIHMLRDSGYLFSLDDFGTGLSSYQYLKNLPVDYLKIDGMFVKDIPEDEFSEAMVKSINDFAHTIGLQTIAEFVSSEAILEKLNELGVDFAQGFYVHKPEPLVSLAALRKISISP